MLDEMIRREVPDVATCNKYGGVLYTLAPDEKEGQFCGVLCYKSHVQISFAHGASMKDPSSILEGAGVNRRHVNFMSADDVNEKLLVPLIRQATQY